LGIADEPGIWRRKNKSRPFTTKRELVKRKDELVSEIRRITARKPKEQRQEEAQSLKED